MRILEQCPLPYGRMLDTIDKTATDNLKNIARVGIGTNIWKHLGKEPYQSLPDDQYFKMFAFSHGLLSEVVKADLEAPDPKRALLADQAAYPLAFMKVIAAIISGDKRGCDEARTLVHSLQNKGRDFTVFDGKKIKLEYFLNFINTRSENLSGEDADADKELYDRLTPSSTTTFRTSSE